MFRNSRYVSEVKRERQRVKERLTKLKKDMQKRRDRDR